MGKSNFLIFKFRIMAENFKLVYNKSKYEFLLSKIIRENKLKICQYSHFNTLTKKIHTYIHTYQICMS